MPEPVLPADARGSRHPLVRLYAALKLAMERVRTRTGRSQRDGPDLGTYEDPPVGPLSPIDRVVEEGVLMSAAAVRMATKNLIIVNALRDHVDYDREFLVNAARQQFMGLANDNDDTAERLDNEPSDPANAVRATDSDIKVHRKLDRQRRPQVHRMLATALRAEAHDSSAIAALVDRARLEAADEIGREIAQRLRMQQFDADPGYSEARAARIRAFIAIDLAALRPRDDSATG